MSTPPPAAICRLPLWFWGGNPGGFFADAGLRARKRDQAEGTWLVKTEERHHRVPPSLVEVHHLAGNRQSSPRFDRIALFAGQRLRGPLSARERQVLADRADRAIASEDIVDAFGVLTLRSLLADQSQLSDIAGHVHGELLDFRFEGENPERVFPHAGVHVVRRRTELVHRIKMAGVLLRLEYDAQLTGGDLSGIKAAHDAGELVFSSSEHLLNGATFLDVYVGPLMGAASPAMWNLYAAREFGIVVYSLGRFIVAAKGDAAEMLNFLPIRGATESVPTPVVGPGACSAALEWWGAKLNSLFGVLTDPATFTDHAKKYVPVKHLQAISTVEQLFKRVTSMEAAHRDVTARRVLFFSVMDTLDRLTGRPIERHCSLQFATETLDRLRAAIPAEAAEVLLPGAERAVAALRKVQDGFYLARQFGVGEIDVLNDGAAAGKLSLESAAGEYLEMLRNATHGFGSNRSGRVGLTNTLLAHHDGDVPHDIGFLGYLYLLDLLSRPEVLRGALYRGGRP